MARPPEPIFLARDTYRRRRLIDAVRLLPVAGAAFFLIPMLGSDEDARSTVGTGAYLFGVWAVLIVLAAVFTRRLARAPGGVASDPLEADPGGRDQEPGAPEGAP